MRRPVNWRQSLGFGALSQGTVRTKRVDEEGPTRKMDAKRTNRREQKSLKFGLNMEFDWNWS